MIKSTLALFALFALPLAARGGLQRPFFENNAASSRAIEQDPDEASLENGPILLEFQWDELHVAQVRETSGTDEKRMDVEYLTRWTTDADAGTTLISFETPRVHMLNGVENKSKLQQMTLQTSANMLGTEPNVRVDSSGAFVELVDEDERLDALMRFAEFNAKVTRNDESFDAEDVRQGIRAQLIGQAQMRWFSWGGVFAQRELREDDSYELEDEVEGRGSERTQRSWTYSFGEPHMVDGVWRVDAECEVRFITSRLVDGENGSEPERVTFAVEELEFSGRYEVETLRPLRARWELNRRTEGDKPSSWSEWHEYVFDWDVDESPEAK